MIATVIKTCCDEDPQTQNGYDTDVMTTIMMMITILTIRTVWLAVE